MTAPLFATNDEEFCSAAAQGKGRADGPVRMRDTSTTRQRVVLYQTTRWRVVLEIRSVAVRFEAWRAVTSQPT